MKSAGLWLLVGGLAAILITRVSAVGLLLGVPAVAAALPLVSPVPGFARAVVRGLGQSQGVPSTSSDGRLRMVWGRAQAWARRTGDLRSEAAVLLGVGALFVLTILVAALTAVFVALIALLVSFMAAGSKDSSVPGVSRGSPGGKEGVGGGARDLAFREMSPSGYPLITVGDAGRVFEGASVSGAPLYTVVGNRLFKGAAVSGIPLATLSNGRIFRGQAVSGRPIATLRGTHAFKGQAPSGSPLVTVPSGDRVTLFAAAYHSLRGT